MIEFRMFESILRVQSTKKTTGGSFVGQRIEYHRIREAKKHIDTKENNDRAVYVKDTCVRK